MSFALRLRSRPRNWQPREVCVVAPGIRHAPSPAIGLIDLAGGAWSYGAALPSLPSAKGMAFSGNGSGYITTTTPRIFGHGYTFAAWVLFSDVTTNQGIAAVGTTSNGHRIQIDVNAGTIRNICVGSATGVASAAITANRWTHIVCVGTSTTSRVVYVNGIPGGVDTTSVAFSGLFDRANISAILASGTPATLFALTGARIVDPLWMNVALSSAEAKILAMNHWQVFAP